MAPQDSVAIYGSSREALVMAAQYHFGPGEFSTQKTLDWGFRVIRKGIPDPSRMYIMTDPKDWSESVVLYGPAPYDELVKVRDACEVLAGAPVTMRYSSLGLGDGILNGFDLSGL